MPLFPGETRHSASPVGGNPGSLKLPTDEDRHYGAANCRHELPRILYIYVCPTRCTVSNRHDHRAAGR